MFRRAVVPAAAVAVLFAAMALTLTRTAFPQLPAHSTLMVDFKAFDCAARVRMEGQDPYAAAPIAACERAPAPAPLFVAGYRVAEPAPLPGYLIAAFMPLALLLFAAAAWLWAALLLAAFAGAIVLLARLEIGDPWVLTVALAIAVIGVSFATGELAPIALFGIALAAWAAARDRPAWLGLGIAFAMVEPQIGLAAAIASAALSRRFALAAAGVLATLTAISIVALGIAENVTYVRDVLPAHMLSELPAVIQFSLSWVLDRVGVAGGPALMLGRLQWLLMMGAAFYVARSRFGGAHRDFAVLAAAALAVVGGPFLHLDHIALALPAALWLCAKRPSGWMLAAAICLALPAIELFSSVPLVALAVAVAAWLSISYTRRLDVALRAIACVLVAEILLELAVLKTGATSTTVESLHSISPSLAQASWAAYVRNHLVFAQWSVWLLKAPTWFGVLTTAVASLVVAAPAPKRKRS